MEHFDLFCLLLGRLMVVVIGLIAIVGILTMGIITIRNLFCR